MSTLDYTVELDVKCPNRDVNDAIFIQVTTTIRGRDVVEEFLTCGVYPLSAGFGFGSVSIDMTTMSKVEMPLSVFPVEVIPVETANHFFW
jgi:hypothetical protein